MAFFLVFNWVSDQNVSIGNNFQLAIHLGCYWAQVWPGAVFSLNCAELCHGSATTAHWQDNRWHNELHCCELLPRGVPSPNMPPPLMYLIPSCSSPTWTPSLRSECCPAQSHGASRGPQSPLFQGCYFARFPIAQIITCVQTCMHTYPIFSCAVLIFQEITHFSNFQLRR